MGMMVHLGAEYANANANVHFTTETNVLVMLKITADFSTIS